MASAFTFPKKTPAEIAEALHCYGVAPDASLRTEDIADPHPDLLPGVLSLFLANIVGDDLDQRALDNPEHDLGCPPVMGLYLRARDFLESIEFRGLTLRDLLCPDPGRVVLVLSAIVNYLHFRQEKLNHLEPIVDELPNYGKCAMELRDRIAELEHEKAIEDHE